MLDYETATEDTRDTHGADDCDEGTTMIDHGDEIWMRLDSVWRCLTAKYSPCKVLRDSQEVHVKLVDADK